MQVLLGALEENFSRLTAKLETMHGNNVEQSSSPKGRLQEPPRKSTDRQRSGAQSPATRRGQAAEPNATDYLEERRGGWWRTRSDESAQNPAVEQSMRLWNAALDEFDRLLAQTNKNQISADVIQRLGSKIDDAAASLPALSIKYSTQVHETWKRAKQSQEHLEAALGDMPDHELERMDYLLGFAEIFSRSISTFDTIYENSFSEGALQEPRSRFEIVAQKAAELAEDIKSLEEPDRAQISKMLRIELGLSFSDASSSSGNAPLAFPILPSSEVLSEKARRKAPKQKWPARDRSLKQTPVSFIRTVYSDRLGRGFTQADLKACDKSCYDALHQWLRRIDPETGKQNRIPPDVDLPSVEDWNARRVRQLRMHPGSIDDEERHRLSYIIAGRTYRGNEIK
ncbi:hypothetical protein [Bradyrhizobium sp. LMTR 3]|uniref:hypothetical protein n=1 Tax=Bradyrhizobium sp. LMTR 3 TaxID=189873 RepID=UPI0011476810|nr:hypothetical protein [Bradyrhizobium sp. LMTR 3]